MALHYKKKRGGEGRELRQEGSSSPLAPKSHENRRWATHLPQIPLMETCI